MEPIIAFISRVIYPDPAANSVQTIQMAAALSQYVENTGLFVHDLSAPEEEIRRVYGVGQSSLKFWPLRALRWPAPIYNHAVLRFLIYNSGAAAILSLHPAWRGRRGQYKVVFVRSRLEILYWGLIRPYLPWMQNRLFVAEIHDLPGGANQSEQDPDRSEGTASAGRARRMLQALRRYDLIITVNQALADDLYWQSNGQIRAVAVPLCSGLMRLPDPPKVSLPNHRVVLGYFGTVDLAHGIDVVIRALDYLPAHFTLRLTGRIRDDAKSCVEAACRTGRVECVEPVPYACMEKEIDACHIAIVPAGKTVHAVRYRSPLKIFDAWMRGKAIVAADVSCHRELLCDGENAVLYRSGDPQDLANKVLALASCPQQLKTIARAGWETAVHYTYPARAQTLLRLMDEARMQKRGRKPADD